MFYKDGDSKDLSKPGEEIIVDRVATDSAPSPKEKSACFYISILVGVSLFLTVIPITIFLVVNYTRKREDADDDSLPKVEDNGTMCSYKIFDQMKIEIENWLYSIDDNVYYRSSRNLCYNNLTCVQNTVSKYTNDYAICKNLYFFPGSFGSSINDIKCDNVHIAYINDKTCDSSVVGYITDRNRDLFLCPDFIENITDESFNNFNKLDLMNFFFNRFIYSGNISESITFSNSTLHGLCDDFVGDVTVNIDQNAILCMTELYLACN